MPVSTAPITNGASPSARFDDHEYSSRKARTPNAIIYGEEKKDIAKHEYLESSSGLTRLHIPRTIFRVPTASLAPAVSEL